jgi:tRNA-(ms[2]io[6]A)-hydroxylase
MSDPYPSDNFVNDIMPELRVKPGQRPTAARPTLPAELTAFLGCATPHEWLIEAPRHLDTLIIDHANCEKKAASTALSLLYRYTDKTDLLSKLSQLAREELLHFEQVLEIMQQRDIPYRAVSASGYAQGLLEQQRKTEPYRLIDTLIIGAFIEARSCERFHALISFVDPQLGRYYAYLLKSESRHFVDYLALAQQYLDEAGFPRAELEERIAFFRTLETALILTPCTQFRFHSGPLIQTSPGKNT